MLEVHAIGDREGGVWSVKDQGEALHGQGEHEALRGWGEEGCKKRGHEVSGCLFQIRKLDNGDNDHGMRGNNFC